MSVVVRTALLFGISLGLAYVLHLFSVSAFSGEATVRPLVVFDHVQQGQHILKGYVTLPSPCHTFVATVDEVQANKKYMLTFLTLEDATRDCSAGPVERPFSLVLFAPSVGVTFSATIDGVPTPVYVIHSYTS